MFRRLFNHFKIGPQSPPLGRWSRTEKPSNDIKIDWANVDHCGTCMYDQMKKKIKEIDITKMDLKNKTIK